MSLLLHRLIATEHNPRTRAGRLLSRARAGLLRPDMRRSAAIAATALAEELSCCYPADMGLSEDEAIEVAALDLHYRGYTL